MTPPISHAIYFHMLNGIAWRTKSPRNRRASIEGIEPFTARGMRCVYGRNDYLSKRFHMDIWQDHKGRLLVRFWCRSEGVAGRSMELLGVRPRSFTDRRPDRFLEDEWIPEILRLEYAAWIWEKV